MANSKKSVGVLLKSSLIMILLGAVIFVTGLSLTSCSYKESDFIAEQFTEAARVDALFLDVTTRNIDIIGNADEFKVDYFNYDKSTVNVSIDSGNLIITETIKDAPFEWLNWSWNWLKKIDQEKATVHIYLPDDVAKLSKISATTGKISISDISFGKGFEAVTTTGNIIIENITVTESLKAESTTGNITINGLTAESVAVHITTGNIKADAVTADAVSFKTTTGKISFDALTALTTEAESTTGSINGKFTSPKSEYDITVSYTTGSSNVSNQTVGQGKSIKAKVTTGKITLNFA